MSQDGIVAKQTTGNAVQASLMNRYSSRSNAAGVDRAALIQMLSVAEDDTTGALDLSRITKWHPSIHARILQRANSVGSGSLQHLSSRETNLKNAVMRIGFEEMRCEFASALFQADDNQSNKYWRQEMYHSIFSYYLARDMAAALGKNLPLWQGSSSSQIQPVQTAGSLALLIGSSRLILSLSHPDVYRKILKFAIDEAKTFDDAANITSSIHIGQLNKNLLSAWGTPAELLHLIDFDAGDSSTFFSNEHLASVCAKASYWITEVGLFPSKNPLFYDYSILSRKFPAISPSYIGGIDASVSRAKEKAQQTMQSCGISFLQDGLRVEDCVESPQGNNLGTNLLDVLPDADPVKYLTEAAMMLSANVAEGDVPFESLAMFAMEAISTVMGASRAAVILNVDGILRGKIGLNMTESDVEKFCFKKDSVNEVFVQLLSKNSIVPPIEIAPHIHLMSNWFKGDPNNPNNQKGAKEDDAFFCLIPMFSKLKLDGFLYFGSPEKMKNENYAKSLMQENISIIKNVLQCKLPNSKI